jgi:signal transduction histidine kinase
MRYRHLLIQTYVFLAGGLIAVTALLDLGFNALLERQARTEDPWRQSTIALIETALEKAPPQERPALAAQLAVSSGMGVQVLDADDIATSSAAAGESLVDTQGRTDYLRRPAGFAGAIRVGPLPPPADSRAIRYLPALFYLSILVIVGLWLRPLLRDLRLLTDAAQNFAADYREPLHVAPHMRRLNSLGANLDAMSQQLSRLIQHQKELAAALSHEMRTPLARIRFALAVIGNQSEPGVKARLTEINGDVQQIDELIARILEFARLDHPDVRMHWQRVTVQDWLRQVLPSPSATGPAVEVNLAPGCDSLQMEPRLMELALSNLLANADRYAQRRVRLTLSSTAGTNCISVEDDGEGVPEAEREAVFRAFRRLDTRRNQEVGGHGLGLAIVARVAALHGGEASVSASAALGGACFKLRWPADQAQERRIDPPPDAPDGPQ